MARAAAKLPTELELEILKVLWQLGSASVRQVRDALVPFRELAYTSVMTMLTIMARKGYVKRKKEGRSYVYQAKYHEHKASSNMLRDVIDRLFGGSPAAVMQHLIETSDLDDAELKQIRQLINRKARGT